MHEKITGRGDPRKLRNPIADGCIERFWRERAALVADDDVGPARFQSDLPAFLKATGHPNERHNCGDADGNSRESQSRAQRTTPKTTEDDSEEGHGLPSETI